MSVPANEPRSLSLFPEIDLFSYAKPSPTTDPHGRSGTPKLYINVEGIDIICDKSHHRGIPRIATYLHCRFNNGSIEIAPSLDFPSICTYL